MIRDMQVYDAERISSTLDGGASPISAPELQVERPESESGSSSGSRPATRQPYKWQGGSAITAGGGVQAATNQNGSKAVPDDAEKKRAETMESMKNEGAKVAEKASEMNPLVDLWENYYWYFVGGAAALFLFIMNR